MESFSDQELFEIFIASVANSAYPKLIFSLSVDGTPKTPGELAWEQTIAEEQGFVPLTAYRSKSQNGWVFFSAKTGLVGFVDDSFLMSGVF